MNKGSVERPQPALSRRITLPDHLEALHIGDPEIVLHGAPHHVVAYRADAQLRWQIHLCEQRPVVVEYGPGATVRVLRRRWLALSWRC